MAAGARCHPPENATPGALRRAAAAPGGAPDSAAFRGQPEFVPIRTGLRPGWPPGFRDSAPLDLVAPSSFQCLAVALDSRAVPELRRVAPLFRTAGFRPAVPPR